jgi:hypothetical protein
MRRTAEGANEARILVAGTKQDAEGSTAVVRDTVPRILTRDG